LRRPTTKKVITYETKEEVVEENKTTNYNSDDVDFEIEYTNDELNLVSKPVNQKKTTYIPEDEEDDEDFSINFIEKQKTESSKRENSSEEEERVRKALERMKLMESMKQQKLTQKNIKVERSAKSIDELENEPAYKRRNIEINHESTYKGKEISKFNLSDEDDDSDLSENSSLNDNVD